MTTLLVLDLPLDQLTIGHDFRIDDDPEAMQGLIESVRSLGVLSPLLVRQTGDSWEVIAGRRRLAAARQVGLSTVPCIERPLDDQGAEDVALAENLHRRQLSPIEEALGYQRLAWRGLSQYQIAARTGRSQPHISRHLRLLDLPDRTRGKVHLGLLAVSTALDERPSRPTGRRQGTTPRPAPGGQDESVLITHWRRRHDRLVAGIRDVLDRLPSEHRPPLRALLTLDLTPLDELPSETGDPNPHASMRGRRGSAPPPAAKGFKTGAARHCANPQCGTSLARSNPGSLCARCEQRSRTNPRAFRAAAR